MSMRSYSRAGITRRLFNTPLAVTPATAAIVLGAVGPRFDVSQLLMHAGSQPVSIKTLQAGAESERAAISAKRNLDERRPDLTATQVLDVDQGVAHINIRGELVAENGGGVSPDSGFTGYDAVSNAWALAQRDPQVRGVLLDVDSPGGEVVDLNELTQRLMASRGNKPSRAIIRGQGCSAAYAIACCCDEVTVQELGYAGSIGVIALHADFSGQLAQEGVKVTLITAGAHKADGNPFQPLPEAVKAEFQADIDRAYAMFVAHVATARGMSEDAVRATEARVYQGQQAVDAGLANKVMGWADSQAEFVAAVNARQPPAKPQRSAAAQRPTTETKMADTPNDAPAADSQPATITAEAHTTAVAAARAEGRKAGAEAERARITALVEICPDTSMSSSLTTAITEGHEPGAFAIGLAQAAKARGASVADLRAGAVSSEQLPDTRKPDSAAAKTGAERGASIVARAAALGHPAVAHLKG